MPYGNQNYSLYTDPVTGQVVMPQMYPQVQQPMYQPNQMQPQNQQMENSLVWVQGKEGATAYPQAPGRTVVFRDDQNPYIYIKTTDNTGKTSDFQTYMRIDDVDKKEEKAPIPAFVTKEDFEITVKKLEEEIKRLQTKPNFNNRNNYYKGKRGDNE